MIMLTFVVMLLGTMTLSAQNPERRQRGAQTQVTAESRADNLAKELDLTEQQKAEVLELFKKQDVEREKNRAANGQNREFDREAFQAERKAQDAELEKIIGAEKFKLLQQKRAERQLRMKEQRGN